LYNGAVDIARHRPGSVCISMLHTRDRDRASAFYTRLTGWSAQERDACTLFEQDGKVVAALTGNGADEWVPYVSVEDLDATIAAAMLLGAQAASRLVLPGVAQVAMLRDPEGARVGLWQPTPHQGAEMMEATGSLWWSEVLSDEPPRAKEFYSRVVLAARSGACGRIATDGTVLGCGRQKSVRRMCERRSLGAQSHPHDEQRRDLRHLLPPEAALGTN
jgi:predicted enzyme related to lactoylglutathione lyase